jgi:hypothetical protein
VSHRERKVWRGGEGTEGEGRRCSVRRIQRGGRVRGRRWKICAPSWCLSFRKSTVRALLRRYRKFLFLRSGNGIGSSKVVYKLEVNYPRLLKKEWLVYEMYGHNRLFSMATLHLYVDFVWIVLCSLFS